jgi:hypothetical protein
LAGPTILAIAGKSTRIPLEAAGARLTGQAPGVAANAKGVVQITNPGRQDRPGKVQLKPEPEQRRSTMKIRFALAALAVATTIGVAAYAQHHGGTHGGGGMTAAEMHKMMEDMMPKDTDSTATKAFKEAHMKMMKGMHIAYSGNANVDFVRGMIPHHQGAIDMAKVVLDHGNDPEVTALARQIIADQTREIAQMQEWLKKNAK